jgi:hypothetical protein
VLVHDGVVGAATAEDAAVDFRVQGLDPAIHHFGEAGVVGHFHRVYAVVLEQLVGAAGGQDLDTELLQLTGEFEDTGLVGDADQGAADGRRVVWSVISISITRWSQQKGASVQGAPFWMGFWLTASRTA